MAIYGYTKNYKLIKPQFNTDTWHDYIYDNLDTIDAVMSAIYASGNWKGFWAKNMTYVAGDVIIDQDTDTMYKVMIDHVTSADTFAAEQTAHPDYYELWSPNNLAESWAIKTDGKVSNTDYSAKAYAISSGLIDDGSAKEWAVGSGAIGNTGEYSAKKYATDAHNDYISLTTNVNVVAVGSNIANVNAVGQSISSVNTVANDISSVNVAATNIEFIKSAEGNANDAKNSKIEAQNSAVTAQLMAAQAQEWATKTDGKVDGTEYSSKYYAGQASTSAQAAQNALDTVNGLIATPIGTIFQSIYVDESLDIARKLNGQLISSTKFTGFRSWLNTVQTAIPNLFTTETNWQAEKTNSKLGQCGKFVVDDTAGTIRLPCVVNSQGLTDLQYLGTIKNESLPNITGEFAAGNIGFNVINGAFYGTNNYGSIGSVSGEYSDVIHLDASRSSSTYQDNAPVQQEAVQYPYYIQVATGVEETLPAIREYNINTPFFFGQSMYSDVAPDNASWLASNGQWNAKSVYPDYYDWLLEKRNSGVTTFYGLNNSGSGNLEALTTSTTISVNDLVYTRLSSTAAIVLGYVTAISGTQISYHNNANGATGTLVLDASHTESLYKYSQSAPNVIVPTEVSAWPSVLPNTTDYDWVVNTADETFRLPLLNGEEDLPSDGRETLNLPNSGNTITATKNGKINLIGINSTSYRILILTNTTNEEYENFSAPEQDGAYGGISVEVKKGDVVRVEYNGYSSYGFFLIPAVGNGNLYYYVGDTVQDASLINAGAVLGQLSNKADIDASNFNADGKSLLSGLSCMSNGVLISQSFATSTEFTAPDNGWFTFRGVSTASPSRCFMANISVQGIPAVGGDTPASGALHNIVLRVKKGDKVSFQYINLNISYDDTSGAWFYPDVGEV